MSELFLGAMTFGEQGGGAPPDECRRILDLYADAGGNASIQRTFIAVVRARAFSASSWKAAATASSLRRSTPSRATAATRTRRATTARVLLRRWRRACGGCGTDYIDVYWVHLWDRHTPVEETMRALDDAVRAGKILYIGLSDTPAWVVSRANTLAEWRGWTSFAGLQVPYNLLNRDIERELLPMAETLGMTVATWGPLASGVLSGKFTRPGGAEPDTRTAPQSLGPREHAAARAVQEVADEVGATPAQVPIPWTRARSRAVHPILGAGTAEQLKDNLGTLDVKLPDDAVRRLEAAAEFTVGFPGDFIAQASPALFGEVSGRLDGR